MTKHYVDDFGNPFDGFGGRDPAWAAAEARAHWAGQRTKLLELLLDHPLRADADVVVSQEDGLWHYFLATRELKHFDERHVPHGGSVLAQARTMRETIPKALQVPEGRDLAARAAEWYRVDPSRVQLLPEKIVRLLYAIACHEADQIHYEDLEGRRAAVVAFYDGVRAGQALPAWVGSVPASARVLVESPYFNGWREVLALEQIPDRGAETRGTVEEWAARTPFEQCVRSPSGEGPIACAVRHFGVQGSDVYPIPREDLGAIKSAAERARDRAPEGKRLQALLRFYARVRGVSP